MAGVTEEVDDIGGRRHKIQAPRSKIQDPTLDLEL
jgi:hypothetical protein